MRGHFSAFLGDGSEFEGKYTCTGMVVLDTKFRGDIVSTGMLVIDEHGIVHADIQAESLVVRGEMVGTVVASERVELKATARVTGDIETPLLVMEQGAVHDGLSRMAKAAEAPHGVVVPMKGLS
jgi:cytoskeletal protein CcmA (bactofilin family)